MPKGEQSPQFEVEKKMLSDREKESITLRASVRREQQNFKVEALNLEQPGSTEAMKETYERTLTQVNREATGEAVEEKAPDELLKESSRFEEKAQKAEHLSLTLQRILPPEQQSYVSCPGKISRKFFQKPKTIKG